MDAEQRRKIFLCNALSLSVSVIILMVLINDYFIAGNILAGHRRLIVFLFLLLVPVINYFGRPILGKIILVFIPGFIVFIGPIIVGDFFPGQLLWFHYGTAIVSAFPILLFHHKRERVYSWLFFLFYFILTIYIDDILIYYNPIDYGLSNLLESFTDYKVPPIFLSIMFCSVVYWFNTINVKYSHKLKQINDDLNHTNEELLTKTEQLDELNRNLERIIKERTAVIASKEKQIIEYANLNAHKVRGPLARILGLINLTNHIEDEGELKKLIEKMDYSALELNEIIKEMNRILSDN